MIPLCRRTLILPCDYISFRLDTSLLPSLLCGLLHRRPNLVGVRVSPRRVGASDRRGCRFAIGESVMCSDRIRCPLAEDAIHLSCGCGFGLSPLKLSRLVFIC